MKQRLGRWDPTIFTRNPHEVTPCLCDIPRVVLERQFIRACVVNPGAFRLGVGLGFTVKSLLEKESRALWRWLNMPPPLRTPLSAKEFARMHTDLHEGKHYSTDAEECRAEQTAALAIGSYLMRVAAGEHDHRRAKVISLSDYQARQPTMERVYTRDAMVPLVEGDDRFHFGWQCIPQMPSSDDNWEIFDSSKDYKTGWQRLVTHANQENEP